MIFDFFKDVMKKIDKEKITQSSAVNVEGYVLDAREKNPSISGTMANQISELNTNLNNNGKYTSAVNYDEDNFHVRYRLENRRCFLEGKTKMDVNLTSGNQVEICSVPVPAEPVFFPCVLQDSSGNITAARGMISKNGKVGILGKTGTYIVIFSTDYRIA